jgi:hypothetical protein
MDPVLILVIACTAVGLAVVVAGVLYAIFLVTRYIRGGLIGKKPSKPVVPAIDEPALTADKVFEVHRNYMEHEDQLIFHRTTLIATIQGFLLATFGISLQKFYEKLEITVVCNFSPVQKEHPLQTFQDLWLKVLQPERFQDIIILEFNFYLMIIIITGIAISLIGIASIGAAKNSIVMLQEHWELYYYQGKSSAEINAEFRILPGITGGGAVKNRSRGISFVTWVPWFFGWLWALIFCVRIIFVVFEGVCMKFGVGN